MADHSSTLAWKIPWAEEPGGLHSIGSRRVGHNSVTSLSLFTLRHWRREWQPTPVFLLGQSQGQRSLVGCCLWDRTGSDTTEATQQQQQQQCRSRWRHWFDLWVGKIPWRRAWQPTPVFLPGELHGQRSLAGYSPQDCKESDMTEVTEHACNTFYNNFSRHFLSKDIMLSCVSCVQLCVTPQTAPNRFLCPWDSPGKSTAVDCPKTLNACKIYVFVVQMLSHV